MQWIFPGDQLVKVDLHQINSERLIAREDFSESSTYIATEITSIIIFSLKQD
jgi:hypothetical protein